VTSLKVSGVPAAGTPTLAEFGWAVVIGVAATLLGTGIRRLGLVVRGLVEHRLLLLTPAAGLVVGLLAFGYAEATGHATSEVLFSGQAALGPLITHSAGYSVGALLLLLACKSLAYGLSLGSFRGGPIFPAMFLGAAGGIALSHLPGLRPVAGAAMGIGAMCVVMLGFPLVSVLLPSLLLAADGLQVMPLVIVAVVVAYVGRAWLDGGPTGATPSGEGAATDRRGRRSAAQRRPHRAPTGR
jgi:hypothetical protein